MKVNMKRIILNSFILSFIFFACNKEEQPDLTPEEPGEENTTQKFDLHFSSENNFFWYPINFIVLSDLHGETIFDTIGPKLDLDVSLTLDTGVVVNATLGYITDDQFYIVSYSDVNSGAELDLSRDWKTDECFQSGPVDRNRATLYITDVDAFMKQLIRSMILILTQIY